MAELAPDVEIEVPLDEAPALDSTANPSRAVPPPEPEIEVIAEAPKPKPPKKIAQPDEGIEKLKQQLADKQRETEQEQERRRAAEARATSAEATANTAIKEAADSRTHLVATAILSVNQTLDAAEAALAAAHAAGDFAQVAKLNRQMATEGAKLSQLEAEKQRIENSPPPRAVITDPVEKLASGMHPQSAAWIRAHPQYATGNSYQEMVGAHNMAIARGLEPNTAPYFKFIERKLDLDDAPASVRTDVDLDPAPVATHVDTTPQRATGGRAMAPAAAPVSRSGTGNGSKPRTYTLSPEQREAAKISGISEREYALACLAEEEKSRLN